MDIKINQLRATAFPSKECNFTEENIPLFINALSNLKLVPSVEQSIKVEVKGTSDVKKRISYFLVMKKLDDSFKITLTDDRFDMESLGDLQIEEFCEKAKFAWMEINKNIDVSYSRLAIGMETMWKFEEEEWCNLVDRELQPLRKSKISEYFQRKAYSDNYYVTDNVKSKTEAVKVNEVVELRSNSELIKNKILNIGFDFNTQIEVSQELIKLCTPTFTKKAFEKVMQLVQNPMELI